MSTGISWKGSISFGLIYIPVNLQVAAAEEDVSFNLLHKKCGNRINYKKICTVCNEEVKQEDLVKGYHYEDGKYAVMTEDDFEKIKTARDRSINIEQFVSLVEIDPIYYEKSYYVTPTGGEKPFALLAEAMKRENKVGIAKTVLGTKESLVTLRADGTGMLLNTLFFANEIRSSPAASVVPELIPSEVNLACSLINSMTSAFQPGQYHDEYRERLEQAIQQKIHGQEIVAQPEQGAGNVVDLMEALQASLRAAELKKRKTS